MTACRFYWKDHQVVIRWHGYIPNWLKVFPTMSCHASKYISLRLTYCMGTLGACISQTSPFPPFFIYAYYAWWIWFWWQIAQGALVPYLHCIWNLLFNLPKHLYCLSIFQFFRKLNTCPLSYIDGNFNASLLRWGEKVTTSYAASFSLF